MDPFKTSGAVSWAELTTSDAAGAVGFYRDVLAWGQEEVPMGGMSYYVMRAGPINAGGIMQRPSADIPVFWGYYITVEDVDAVAARAEAAGGALVVAPQDIQPGRFCGLTDPDGAYISAIAYSNPEGEAGLTDFADAFTTPGLFSWIELRTHDAEAAAAFYIDLFGWNIQVQDMPTGPYHLIRVGEVGIGGIVTLPEEHRPPGWQPHWGGYITVDDADKVEEDVLARGGDVLASAFDVPGVGRMAHFADPQGGAFAVIKYLPM